jgi:HTH-type transcriptional regulator/antitoxin HigA
MVENQYIPDEVSPPGETLLEVLEERGITQADLADRMGRPRKTINEIIKGKAAITPETALQLERVLGVPASFWNNREKNYREFVARKEERKRLEERLPWADPFPIQEMIRRGWIPDRRPDKVSMLESLLQFFGIASPDQWQAVWAGVDFRRARKSNEFALSAWLRQGQRIGESLTCADYDETRFKAALIRIRELTLRDPEEIRPRLSGICAECGVAITFVPEFPSSGASGATLWLGHSRPVLMLSLRYKTDDHLWFTFFHEAGHILLHGKRKVFIEGTDHEDQREEEADRFAAESLIPSSALKAFTTRHPHPGSEDIRQLAEELGIAPGIIVGRLQHDGLLPRTHCNELKQRIEWT